MMNKKLLAAAPLAALLAGGATVLSAENPGSGGVPSANEFNPIQRYAITYDDPRDVAEFYLRDFGLKAYDAEFQELDHPSDASMRVVLVTVDGIRDDVVQGVQWRFGVRASAGSWEAVEAGMRRKCYRGQNAHQWTRDVCP